MLKQLCVGLAWLSASSAMANTYVLDQPNAQIVGHDLTLFAREDDTLLEIARNFGIGHHHIVSANPEVDVWLPKLGTPVVIPNRVILPEAKRQGVVINLAELRLFHFETASGSGQTTVTVHPIGIGREGWHTPLGVMSITQKRENPSWTPTANIRAAYLADGVVLPAVVPPGPDNPLGQHALRLSNPSYLIHGTHKPYGVGMRVSSGCIRLFPEDIKALYQRVNTGTRVEIVYQPHKAAFENDTLYLEAHKPREDIDGRHVDNLTPMVSAIIQVADNHLNDDTWPVIESVVHEHRARVVAVGESSPEMADDVWFLHAGMRHAAIQKMLQTAESLGMETSVWTLRGGATQERLLGPFDSYAQAMTAATAIETAAEMPIWTVLVPRSAL